MQTRSAHLDHHHQNDLGSRSSAEAELIALSQRKGQRITAHTLNLIRESLELRGVSLDAFVADVRPHFKNNILNPSGFLINRARRFYELSRPAAVCIGPAAVPTITAKACAICKEQKFVIRGNNIEPCPECSTPQIRRAWATQEAGRAKRSGRTP
jgi:hypothetical protein